MNQCEAKTAHLNAASQNNKYNVLWHKKNDRIGSKTWAQLYIWHSSVSRISWCPLKLVQKRGKPSQTISPCPWQPCHVAAKYDRFHILTDISQHREGPWTMYTGQVLTVGAWIWPLQNDRVEISSDQQGEWKGNTSHDTGNMSFL